MNSEKIDFWDVMAPPLEESFIIELSNADSEISDDDDSEVNV